MPEEKDPKPTDGGVRQLHFIYHVTADTNQLIKVEQLDEATGSTTEVPLPLLVSFSETDVEAPAAEAPPPFNAEFAANEFVEKPKKKKPPTFDPKAGPLRFVAAKGIPTPKAGPLKFVPPDENEDS